MGTRITPNFNDLFESNFKLEPIKLPNINLHYGLKDYDGDIPIILLEDIYKLHDAFCCSGYFDDVVGFDWIREGLTFDECASFDRIFNTVFSVSIESEIFVTDKLYNALLFVSNAFKSFDLNNFKENILDVWILEWESFEDAYKYCLGLKEENSLCYSF